MTSNNLNNKGYRSEFGLKDKNGNRYEDIKKAFILRMVITAEDYDRGFLLFGDKQFILDTDKRMKIQLGLYGKSEAIISVQIRTDNNYAIARVPQELR